MDTWNPRKQQDYLTASDQSLRTVQNPQLSSAREEPDMASSSNNSPSFKIILGSSSPARRAILSDMGYEFATMVEALTSTRGPSGGRSRRSWSRPWPKPRPTPLN
uniref:Maf-like protein n=1 Tax=Aegilops tauschii subsp. strangulata TaxID=200361 RepID=A0A453H953_AEGTS